MSESDVDVKYWKPELVRVTQIGNPEVCDGKETTAFLDPSLICSVFRAMSRWNLMNGERSKPVEATTVLLANDSMLSVIESPEEINVLRNKAYGVKFKPIVIEEKS